MNLDEKVRFLIRPESLQALETIERLPMDDLCLSKSGILGNYTPHQRAALLEQRRLRTLGLKKFSLSKRLLFTKSGLEQSTREALGRYKANRIKGQCERVADLCCGLGGDSFFLADKVTGVDWNPAHIRLYRFNMTQLGKTFNALQADITAIKVKADMAFVDPARRRHGSRNRWHAADMSPSLNEIKKLVSRYGNLALKLAPGIPVPEFCLDGELDFLGVKNECLELTVWFGEAACPGRVCARELFSGESIRIMREDIPGTFNRVDNPGAYLFEPVKVAVRSGLFGHLGERLGLWQIDPRIAYMSGTQPVKHPMLKAYKIVDVCSLSVNAVRKMLRAHDIGKIVIKKRGVSITPDQFSPRLKPAGTNSATLVLTRVMDKKTAFLTVPLP